MTSHATTADDIPTFASSDTPAATGASAEDAEAIDESRLMDHDYDGIREYDNPLPGWWSAVFAATFVFAFLYFAYYNIAHWGRTPAEGYQVALAGWQASYKSGPAGGGINATEEMLAAGAENSGVVAQGAAVFTARCIGCHADGGRGLIGPNLTDLYQIHGTTRMDLYATIMGGVPGTAMIAWGEVMKPTEIVAVATYVSSLRGKNLAGKEPQGKSVPALAR
jgi:cytochrome c oxidase cbb3-type subunit 3